jgi:hypothetical protein
MTEPVSESEDVPEFYADTLNMTFGPFGFGLEFGVLPFPDFGATRVSATTPVPPNPVVRVRVSPQFAQAIKTLLVNNIGIYESIFGEIKIPEDSVGTVPHTNTLGDQA